MILTSLQDRHFLPLHSWLIDGLAFLRVIELLSYLKLSIALQRTHDPLRAQRYVFLGSFILTLSFSLMSLTRPLSHSAFPLASSVILFISAFLLPNRPFYIVFLFFQLAFLSFAFLLRLPTLQQAIPILGLFFASTCLSLAFSFLIKYRERLLYLRLLAVERPIESLRLAKREISVLQDILPICMHCHSIRDDQGYWQSVQRFFRKNQKITLTHASCPSCSPPTAELPTSEPLASEPSEPSLHPPELSFSFHPFFLSFQSPVAELFFRLSTLAKDKKVFFFCFLLPNFFFVFVFPFLPFFSSFSEIDSFFLFRVSFLCFTAFALLLLPFLSSPRIFDLLFFSWLSLSACLSFGFSLLAPPASMLFVHIIFIFFFASFSPNRFAYLLFLFFCTTSAFVPLFLRASASYEVMFFFILGLITYLFSSFFSFSIKKQDRLFFALDTQAKQTLAKLQDAQKEIENLQTMLPLCATCHSIRDDRGYWQRLDRYFQKNRGIRLSHGLCPSCLVEHYSDEMQSDPMLRSAQAQALEQKNRADSSNANLPTITQTR